MDQGFTNDYLGPSSFYKLLEKRNKFLLYRNHLKRTKPKKRILNISIEIPLILNSIPVPLVSSFRNLHIGTVFISKLRNQNSSRLQIQCDGNCVVIKDRFDRGFNTSVNISVPINSVCDYGSVRALYFILSRSCYTSNKIQQVVQGWLDRETNRRSAKEGPLDCICLIELPIQRRTLVKIFTLTLTQRSYLFRPSF